MGSRLILRVLGATPKVKRCTSVKTVVKGVHRVWLNNSRPINYRRISNVPAPISYNIASRNRRPAGDSFMYPIPPRRWMICSANPLACSAAYKNRTRRIATRHTPGIAGLRYGVNIAARGVGGGHHVGELALPELKFADGLAELFAFAHIGQRDIQARAHDARRVELG
jgi:hypothetical protein